MKRSKHSLSNYQLLTADMGQLIPVNWYEVLPGDTFRMSSSALIRCSPLVAPVMHPVIVRLHHFFVPNRLIWNTKIGDSGDFEDFITGGPNGNDAQVVPTVQTTTDIGDLMDYLGTPNIGGIDVSALPVRCYNLIFNEFYRDADLVGQVDLDSQEVQKCAWEKDYFTTARPWTQKGSDVTVPLGGKAYIQCNADTTQEVAIYQNTQNTIKKLDADGTQVDISSTVGSAGNLLFANLEEATSADVNEFRRAFALQRYQEARARYGSRYVEYLRYLGVNPADARLQRPEYLGGGKQTISFSEVLQTQRTDTGESPLGTMGGHGIAAMKSRRVQKFFQEHGVVMTLMSVRPKTMYVQGIARKFLKQDKEEFFQRELAQIGQQEVYNDEVYAVNGDRSVFGYQDRYQEYKQEWSGVRGEFRNLLNYWHLGREFTGAPALNSAFVTCDPSKRIFAEQTQNSLWCMVNNVVKARRMVPKSGKSRIM